MRRVSYAHYSKDDIQYRFYRLFSVDLDTARYSLRMLRRYRRSDIRFCILRDLIVSYARPFSGNKGPSGGGHSLSLKYVPAEYRPLHNELLDLRMQVFAHTDFAYHDPRLSKWDTDQGPIFPMSLRRPGYEGLLSRTKRIRELVDFVDAELQKTLRALEAKHFTSA
jgi:hypothetical protein